MPTLGGNTITLAAGPYTMTYQPSATAAYTALGQTAVGLVDIDGRSLSYTSWNGQDIQSDLYGKTTIESIYQGRNCFLSMTLLEWTAITRAILNPFGPTAAGITSMGDLGQVGRTVTDLAGILILTAVAGTPSATNGPATITASKAIIAKDTDVNILLATDLRKVPIKFQLYPFDSSGHPVFFTTT